ncbi:DUF2971 domain-containing protein [Aeromonas caviae]|uniref:DUF2971 domain-containing protein n=1 Tax=Aeromonas caviae TaxID=648 RepID=UPI002B47147D|nr:DUF2971 domain-containing protein [Aeromonas caviae]
MIEVDNEKEFFRYKYLPFGSDKLSLNVIKEGTIKFTCPKDFNDPFDCHPVSIVIDDVKNSSLYRRTMPKLNLSPAKRLAQENRAATAMKNHVRTGKLQDSVMAIVGVLSLSKTYNNILMWSHYAEYHKGFVVGFRYEMTELVDTHSPYDLHVLPVNYSKQRKSLNYFVDEREYDVYGALLTKSDDWKYEEEVRVLDLSRGHGIHNYNRSKRLHCVIAGARIDQENLSLLKKAVKQASKDLGRKIHLYQARLSSENFSIEIHKG